MNQKSPPVTSSLGFGITPKQKLSSRKTQSAPSAERKARILVVDSDVESCRLIGIRLKAANYSVESVSSAQAALDACLISRPNLVITDLRLDGPASQSAGLALLKELKSRWAAVVVIIVTAHGTIAEAVEATQCGAFGFLVKPIEKSELLGQIERAISSSSFTRVEGGWRADIVSRSQLMDERLALANRAAQSDAPVVLTGENGTGKELLARAIHAAGARREKPFVVVTCRGAGDDISWTSAGRGTLLLDEVGELSPKLQIELLAALQRTEPLDGARLICTTSQNLKALMDAGQFRQDLYHQINILPIEIPPLGRRREDIPLLVSHFLEQATDTGAGKKLYSPDAIELLATTDWPGNVRQLFELVKQNVALSHGKIMSREFVQQSLGEDAKKVPTYDEARDEFARDYLKTNLQTAAGNVSEAARLAKRNRTDFYKLLARYRLEPDDFKTSGHTKRKKPGV